MIFYCGCGVICSNSSVSCLHRLPRSEGYKVVGMETVERSEWQDTLNKQRAAYQSFIEEMIIKPGSEVKSEETVSDHVSPLTPPSSFTLCSTDLRLCK